MTPAAAPTVEAAHRLLAERFGLAEFRPGQAEVIEALLAGRSALAVFPTGSGKSLCYQLPALLLEGVTVVVSPLIALMKDQIDALDAHRRAGRAHRLEPRAGRAARRLRAPAARRAAAALRRARALQQRALPGAARGRADRAVRRGRGPLHLGMGPQLPSRLPQARPAGARARSRARAGADGDRDARRGRRHLRGVRDRTLGCDRDRRLPPEPDAADDAGRAPPIATRCSSSGCARGRPARRSST